MKLKLNQKRAPFYKFVKGQTIFLTELEFFVSVRKMIVLELLKDHVYEYVDPWGEDDDVWLTGPAIKVLEDGQEKILAIDNFDSNSFVSTSSRDALRIVKRFSKDVDHYKLSTKSFFSTHWT